MNYYIYDGSFPGLLTAIYHAFYNPEKPDHIIIEDSYKEGFFTRKFMIETELDKSDRVYQAVKDRISLNALRKIYYVYLSEGENTGQLIYQYLKIGFRMGRKVEQYLNNEIVDQIEKISSRVAREKHLLLGLLRFREIEGGLFYAPFEPDNNIVSLLAPHFARRLSGQYWIIHDRRRKLAAVYNKEEWVLTELENTYNLQFSERERYYQELWKVFFKNIMIENRRNPRCQRQFMPARYWKYLIEK
ncbi:MAG: DNA metabolism protein [Halanaerobiaceae bacterium]|nr:DNA metabolism protein [Halanaerobiaceae bacterium]